eukprot:TRINITY_DN12311_c0_g2_i1.p1 TRINITY_DN12311_c0_g2~~TRINITY_DN12311_c0_g2_i1.p1  ORF type:complete len:1046 (-),score=169.37 TRINITY_DN12311_c0_g2_i1:774-3911(-)
MELSSPPFEIARALWPPLARQINYIQNLNENLEVLGKKMDKLIAREKDVTKEIDSASLDLKIPKNEVLNWLKRVKEVKERLRNIEKVFEEHNTCFRGFFPDYYSRRNISRSALRLITQVDELQNESSFDTAVAFDHLSTTACTIATTHLFGESAKTNMQRIWDCLMNETTGKIGIQGMGGVGKTSLMKHIHNQLKDAKQFDNVIWVTVSKDSNIKKLHSDIANAISLSLNNDCEVEQRSRQLCEALLRRSKFVLILDDLWEAFSLEDIGIPEPDEDNGCKILLTTRLLEVCNRMDMHDVIKVDTLSADDAWTLFSSKVGNDVLHPSEILSVAKQVAGECGGLPLALITVGRAMRKVDNVRVWRNALKELRDSTHNIKGMYSDVIARLKFSYDRLRDDNVRACFLYCSLFPEDHNIRRNDVVDLWIWEGFISEEENRETEWDKGHSILKELEFAGMLESSHESNAFVKMHDLIRDTAISITRKTFMAKAGAGLRDQPKDENWVEEIERISLASNNLRVLSGQPHCPKLLTMLLEENEELDYISPYFFHNMHAIRVLNLSGTRIKSLPDSVSDLVNLRALLLAYCYDLVDIPSLLKLKELRVLNLKWTAIKELPPGMEGLINLRYLELSFTECLEMVRGGVIEKLSRLEDLAMHGSLWKWEDTNSDGVGGISEIIGLRRLLNLTLIFKDLSAFLTYVRSAHWHVLQNFSFAIGGLKLHVAGNRLEVVLGPCCSSGSDGSSLLLPNNTARFEIDNFNGVVVLSQFLPDASALKTCVINFSSNLKCIFADGKNSLLSSIETLELNYLPKFKALSNCAMPNGAFACLKVLRISHCDKLRTVFSLESMQNLQNLEEVFVDSCGQIVEIITGKGKHCGVLPKLKFLRISSCPKLKALFSSHMLQGLEMLEQIIVYYCEGMEQMIAEEEEEGKKEEDGHDDGTCAIESNDVTGKAIALPMLRSLSLTLPKLKCISNRVLICNSLQSIKLESCVQLKNLPLSVENASAAPVRGCISGTREWWDSLKWNNPGTKAILQHLFIEKEGREGSTSRNN